MNRGGGPGENARRCLAIFDIDGTLTTTNTVDDECFTAAIAAVFGLEKAQLNWSEAPHVTDVGIIHWLSDLHRGRVPDDTEVLAVHADFLRRLAGERAVRPGRFASVAGAPGLLRELELAGWRVALATGGWSASARMKLAAAGVDAQDMPFASAEDGLSREEIVMAACMRAGGPPTSWARVVSVGDGVWDVRTAARLGLPFVGIGDGSQAAALHDAGATIVLRDLVDRNAVRHALDSARVPGRQR